MSLIKHTRNTLKFAKIIELVFKLKTKLLNGKYEKEIQEIDRRVNELFDNYKSGKTLKQEINQKIVNLDKQNAYLKYQHYIKPKVKNQPKEKNG